MHLNPTLDKLAALAPFAADPRRGSGGRSRLSGKIHHRNAAIADALRAGHTPAEIGGIVGLTPKWVERLVVAEASAKAAAPVPTLGAPLRLVVDFEGADPRALAIQALPTAGCRWPIEEGDGFRFCGAPATRGYRVGATTYCAACAQLAYRPRGSTQAA